MPSPDLQGGLFAGRSDSSEHHPRLEVELADAPRVAGLYVRGAVRSARLAAANRAHADEPRRGTLADVDLVTRGVRVDADRLTAYQHLLGESAADVLPAGFVHVLAFPVAIALMVRADFPLPFVGMVHLANAIEQRRPLLLGDVLEVRAYARGLRAHRSGTQVDLVTEVRAGAGELAWRGVSTYLAKGTVLAGADDDEPAAHPAPGAPTFAPPAPTGRWRLSADVGRRYAAVSGDRNPIHVSALAARAFGFPRAIAHGMYTASRALATVGSARTDAFTWTVEFGAPVLLPATVAVRVAPTGTGTDYAGWDPRTGRLHLAGTVAPS